MTNMTIEQENQYLQNLKFQYQESQKKVDALTQSYHNQSFESQHDEITFLKHQYFTVAVEALVNKWIWKFEENMPLGSPQHKVTYLQTHFNRLNRFFYKTSTIYSLSSQQRYAFRHPYLSF